MPDERIGLYIDWRAACLDARRAQEAGQISRALSLYGEILAAGPTAAEPFGACGAFSLSLCEGLSDLIRLYHRHCREFGLPVDEVSEVLDGMPVGPAALARATANLQIAGRIAPSEIGWRMELARAFELLDRHDEAIACRVELARKAPAEADNIVALVRLLDSPGDLICAIAVLEELQAAGPGEAVLSLQLASLYARAGRARDAKRLMAKIEQAAGERGEEPQTLADRILPLVSFLAKASPLPLAKPLADSVAQWRAAIDEERPHGLAAMLAVGYCDMLMDRPAEARSSFASASKIADRMASIGTETRDAMVSASLNHARAWFVSGASPAAGSPDVGARVAPRQAALAQARHVRRAGHVFECLSAFWTAAGMAAPMLRPFFFEHYRGYRIIWRDAIWHAVPLDADHPVILGSRVVWVPRLAYRYRRFIPDGFARFVRRRVDLRLDGPPQGRSRRSYRTVLKRVARPIVRGALRLLTVRGSHSAPSADELLNTIDQEAARKSL